MPKHILALKPYEPGRPIEEVERELGLAGTIKLASNENPLGPSPAAVSNHWSTRSLIDPAMPSSSA